MILPKLSLTFEIQTPFRSIDALCRGFLLITTASSENISFIIWNPSTGFKKQFRKQLTKRYQCGIGYDSSTDDYAVVMISCSSRGTDVHCFPCRTNLWSCIKDTVSFVFWGHRFGQGSLLNGALHWLVVSFADRKCKIIAFDLTDTRLLEIPLPPELEDPLHSFHLRVKCG